MPAEREREETAATDTEGSKRVADDRELHRSQSDRFIAKARELGLDEREEAFDTALKKMARHKPLGGSPPSETAQSGKRKPGL